MYVGKGRGWACNIRSLGPRPSLPPTSCVYCAWAERVWAETKHCPYISCRRPLRESGRERRHAPRRGVLSPWVEHLHPLLWSYICYDCCMPILCLCLHAAPYFSFHHHCFCLHLVPVLFGTAHSYIQIPLTFYLCGKTFSLELIYFV